MINKNKKLALALAFIFLASLVTILPVNVKAAAPKTLVVPDDYPTIQAAVGNASNGDTVYVKEGSYHFYYSPGIGLTIDKSIRLIGEKQQKTTFGAEGASLQNHYPPTASILVNADDVMISGVTILALAFQVWVLATFQDAK